VKYTLVPQQCIAERARRTPLLRRLPIGIETVVPEHSHASVTGRSPETPFAPLFDTVLDPSCPDECSAMATPDVMQFKISDSTTANPAAGLRPTRTASQGVAAAVSAAASVKALGPRKRHLLPASATATPSNAGSSGISSPDDNGDATRSNKARRTASRKSASSSISGYLGSRNPGSGLSGGTVIGRGQSPISNDTEATSFPCKICGLEYTSTRTLNSHVLAMHGARDHRKTDPPSGAAFGPTPRRRRSTGHGAHTPGSRGRSRSPVCSNDASNDRCLSPDSGEEGTNTTGGTGSLLLMPSNKLQQLNKQALLRQGSGPKRQNSVEHCSLAVRTRPTNNQLLYKAYFRWQHYPYTVRGARHLFTETEACASVTSAFLQVLSTLHAAESAREDSPRNILQVLSTNTRRTKVVELSSGTHRVPDDLRKHCLTDIGGRQYSTNLDRNRYGSDNQYLNTVIRYDLDFLGLCSSLVDVEIIDAKNPENTILIQADSGLCNCGCDAGEDNEAPSSTQCHKAEADADQRPASPTGMFDMLLLAATGEALSNGGEEDAGCEVEGADANSQATDQEDSGSPSREKVSVFQLEKQCSSNELASLETLEKMRQALHASDSIVNDLRKQVAASSDAVTSMKLRLEHSEAQTLLLKSEFEKLAASKLSADESLAKLQLEKDQASISDALLLARVAELEAQLQAVTRDRDTHAASHSYYAVWVQQLQAEVTNLLKTAHANGGASSMVSPQLVALTQAVNPASSLVAAAAPAPIPSPASVPAAANSLPSESDSDSALRAQYEKELQQLLQQRFQTMLGSTPHGFSLNQPAMAGLMPLGSMPGLGLGTTSRPLPLSSPLLPLDIAPLKNLQMQTGTLLPITSRADSSASSDGSNMHMDLPRPASATPSVNPGLER